jgi:hypothetical protein
MYGLKTVNLIGLMTFFAFPAMATLVLGSTAGLTMTEIDGTAPNPSNSNFVDLARNPTGTTFTSTSTVVQTVNHNSTGQTGAFSGDGTWNNVDGSHFLVNYTGYVDVTQTGWWSLQNYTDDAFFVEFDGMTNWTDTACCNNSQTTRYLTAGVQSIEIIMAEFGGGDYTEFSMAFGGNESTPLTFSASTYKLLGKAQGGLYVATTIITVPQPTTIALLALGLFGTGFARKCRAY